jgi:hypothetical protein
MSEIFATGLFTELDEGMDTLKVLMKLITSEIFNYLSAFSILLPSGRTAPLPWPWMKVLQ